MSDRPNYPPDPNNRPGANRRPDPNAPRDPNARSGANNPAGPDYLSGPGSRPPSPSQPNPNNLPDRNVPPGNYPPQPNYPPVPSSPNPNDPGDASYRAAPNAPANPNNPNVGYPTGASGYPGASSVPLWQPQAPADSPYMGAQVVGARGRGCRRYVMLAAVIAALLLALTLVAAGGSYAAIAAGLPSTDQLVLSNLQQSTKLYDRNGSILYEVFDPSAANGGRRTIVPPEKIPNILKQATIDTEDPSFYDNPGVDWYGIARAIYYDLRYQRVVSGASTITQQLVRNTLITPEPTFQRKIREAVLAMEVTRRYSKEEILALYLNAIYYGNLSYGIQSASQSYFGKNVDQLDLAEATLLAGLPQAPAIYDPCENPDAALTRQQVVLDLMQKRGDVTAQQAQAAAAEMDQVLHSDAFSKHCNAPATLIAPHFVNYVLQQLEQQYGQEVVYKGGLQVYTTLDPTLQNIAQDEATKQVAALKGNNVKSAALVATNPQTGEIYAMLGSVKFDDKSIDGQVNVTTSLRQPGSSIKPINYVTAFEKGWAPSTTILDLITQFPNGGQPAYVPTDYDGKEHGLVDVRTALANSLNIPAVKTLYFVGVKDMIATAQKMGITSFQDPNRYGLTLTLGGGEVKLIELTGAYGVFANQGKFVPVTPYIKILDGQGHVVLDNTKNKPQPQQVLDPRYAYLITSILSDNNARTMEFGANSPLKTSRPTFAKTGTTNDYKDNWTLGGTTELVVGVWVGDPRNTPMKNVSGITGAAPIWHNVVERAYKEDNQFKGVAAHDFPVPPGLVSATVCKESGLLAAGSNCPADHQYSSVFLQGQAPDKPDDVWVKVKVDKTNNKLANDQCPPDIVQETLFEKMPHDIGDLMPYDQVVKWANDHGIPQPPTDPSPCTSQPTPEPTSAVNEVKITAPRDGDTVSGTLAIRGSAAVPDFDHYVLEASTGGNPAVQLVSHDQPVVKGELDRFDTHSVPDGLYTLRLVVFDHSGNQQTDQVTIVVNNQPDTPTPRPTSPATPTPKPTEQATPSPTPNPGGNGPGTYQDNSAAVVYSANWSARTGAQGASGGTIHVSNQSGSTASLTVSGATAFTVTLLGGPNRGAIRVFVDGSDAGSFNSTVPVSQDVTTPPTPLPDTGTHTITIQVQGNRSVALDYITVQ
ncbi:MAG: PBP1A family penicillin-binding protein [Anaerolineae bacterium]